MTYYISSQSSWNVRESAIFHITKILVSLSQPADLSSWPQGFSLTHFPPKNTRKKQKKFWFLFTADGQNWSSGATHMRNLKSPMELIIKTLAESKKKKKLWAPPILPSLFFFPVHGCYKQELRIIVVIAGEKTVCAATAVPDKRNRASAKAMKKKKINKDKHNENHTS